MTTGQKLFNLKGQKDKISCLYLLDKRVLPMTLISAGEDKKIHLWDVITGQHIKMFEGHEEEITAVVSGNFKPLSSFQTIEKNNVKQQKNKAMITLIISASRDRSVRVWDHVEGFALFVLSGHATSVISVTIGLLQRALPPHHAANTPVICSASEDGHLLVWSLDNGKMVKEFKGAANSIKGVVACLLSVDAPSTALTPTPVTPGNSNSKDVLNKELFVAMCGWDKSLIMFNLDDRLAMQESSCGCNVS